MGIQDGGLLNLNLRILPISFQTPKMIFVGFKNEQVSKNELFLHSYEPLYESTLLFFAKSVENPIFSIIKKEVIENDGDTAYEFQSVEDYDVVSATDFASDSDFETEEFAGYKIITRGLNYSEQEMGGLVYGKPVEIQINLDEEITIAQRNYINSIEAREMEFDVVSSLGPITSENTILDSTVAAAESDLTSTTETITDVGGPTATGTRSFTTPTADGVPTTSTATIGGY